MKRAYIFAAAVYLGGLVLMSGDQPVSSEAVRFLINGNGTITDLKTKLVWEQMPSQKVMKWEEAKQYAGSLWLAGVNTWRLPTIDELKVLLGDQIWSGKGPRNGQPFKWLNSQGFINLLEDDYYWSSTEDKTGKSAWGVGSDGWAGCEDKGGGSYEGQTHALCVCSSN